MRRVHKPCCFDTAKPFPPNKVVEVPPRRGMAGAEAIVWSQSHQGTALFDAIAWVNDHVKHDRLVVITDEQSHPVGSIRQTSWGVPYIQGNRGKCPDPIARGYMINVASAQNGIGYGPWVHIDGFSESVLRFIRETEGVADQ